MALAFPDRIAKRRPGGSGRYLLANGRGAAFQGVTGLGTEEYLVAVELDDREREARIDLAVPLTLEELEKLFGAQISTSEQVQWDERTGAVLAQRTRGYGALIIEARILQAVAPELASEAMLTGVRQLGIASLPWDEELRNLQARLEFVRRLERARRRCPGPPLTMPVCRDPWINGCPHWIQGMTRREHLRRVPLREALVGAA